ncbi:MAG: helix-turn-helix transcriptional regulator [Patescibacteria group bacterium]
MEKNIGFKIKEIRDKYKLSQERFGNKIGVSGKTISAYETGKCIPPLKVLNSIAEAYNVSFLSLTESSENKLRQKIQQITTALSELQYIVTELETPKSI